MILGVDTITEKAGVYLGDGTHSFFKPLETKHASDSLIEIIDDLMGEAKTDPDQLEGVIVVKGPGSFTGVRVGVAVANQFAHQLSIPIIGITTDELYDAFVDESDYVYVQTMNRDQVYMVGEGKYERDYPQCIISVSECHSELSSGQIKWFGQLSEDHLKGFFDIELVSASKNNEEGWRALSGSVEFPDKKKYQLVEPFYGKEPTITKSKKH